MDRTKQPRVTIETGRNIAAGVLARAAACGHPAVPKSNAGRAAKGRTTAPSDPKAAQVLALAASAGHPALRNVTDN